MYSTIINAKELAAHLSERNWVIVDCRFSLFDTNKGALDYSTEHIPGAVYAHLDKDLSGKIVPGKTGRHPLPEVDDLVALFSSWGVDRGTQVVVYDNKSGAIAARLWWLFQYLGHERVAVLNGGWKYWVEQGFPVSDEPPVLVHKTFEARIQHKFLVSADFVEALLEQPTHTLIDSRAGGRFRGEEEPIDPIAGHIPGAVNIPFMDNVDDQGMFLEKEDLKTRFKALGEARPHEQTVFYCGSGVTACHNIVAFRHAGLGMPKLYAGSWSEWITDPKRPIE